MILESISGNGRAGIHILPPGKTINAETYLGILQEKLFVWIDLHQCDFLMHVGAPCQSKTRGLEGASTYLSAHSMAGIISGSESYWAQLSWAQTASKAYPFSNQLWQVSERLFSSPGTKSHRSFVAAWSIRCPSELHLCLKQKDTTKYWTLPFWNSYNDFSFTL